ncbi:MAG: sugar transferase [Bacteroidia bacterium]
MTQRVTRFGAFLRNTSLDELPQLINVLRGEIGPLSVTVRSLYEAEQLDHRSLGKRFLLLPGSRVCGR